MNRILEKFINNELTTESNKESFDYNFNEKFDCDKFDNEYKKFLWMYSGFYFHENSLRLSYNDYFVNLSVNDLTQIFKLYRYAYNNNFKEKYVLGEFLLLYYNCIINRNYKSDNLAKEKLKEYNEIQKKYKSIKNIYNELLEITCNFYKMLVNYIVENEEFLYDDIISRIRFNIKSNNKFNEIISKLFSKEKNIWVLVEYDNEVDKHVDLYDSYIEHELQCFNMYKYPIKVIFRLDKENKLKEKTFDLVVNDIVDKINNLYEKVLINSYSIIDDISTIDNFLNQINKFINELQNINNIQKNKLKECRKNLMCIKRYILSNENKIRSSLKEYTYETSIETEKIKHVVDEICNNACLLYSNSTVDFESELEQSLKSYSKHPIIYLMNNYTLDSKHQTYHTFNEKKVSNIFMEYYDKIGEQYTNLNADSLRNKLFINYYSQLLKYLKSTFCIKQLMLIDFFKIENKFDLLIQKFSDFLKISTTNRYSIVAHNVMEIEVMISNILSRYKKTSDNIVNNLFELANIYKENRTAFNGLMYIYYSLYEDSGLKIRNNIAHGNLIGENIDVELIITFSSIILLQWLYNDGKNK